MPSAMPASSSSRPVFALGETHGVLQRFDARVGASSEGLGWTSAYASNQRERPFEGRFHALSDCLMVLHRGEAEDAKTAEAVRKARFVYVADGSPLHLRSVLKDSALFDAMLAAYHSGGVLAASGAGATLLCDPMVDPRGGAYTVGLGVVTGLAVFPYHGSAADHLRERSIDLLPDGARLVGVDEHTALLRDPAGPWRVVGTGAVTVYQGREAVRYDAGSPVGRLDDL